MVAAGHTDCVLRTVTAGWVRGVAAGSIGGASGCGGWLACISARTSVRTNSRSSFNGRGGRLTLTLCPDVDGCTVWVVATGGECCPATRDALEDTRGDERTPRAVVAGGRPRPRRVYLGILTS